MKSVLISIKPKWCELIANRKKTIEVRKTRPKIVTPFKCYIYCTKPSKKHQTVYGGMIFNSDELYRHPKQGIKYGDSIELTVCEDYTKDNFLNGKVIGEFVCDHITKIEVLSGGLWTGGPPNGNCVSVIKRSALSPLKIKEYANGKDIVYGWHISDLVIYDEPKELSEFYNFCDESLTDRETSKCKKCIYHRSKNEMSLANEQNCVCDGAKPLIRPPQSWCYVEEERHNLKVESGNYTIIQAENNHISIYEAFEDGKELEIK